MTDAEFFALCQGHDWWFELSSDRRRVAAGRKVQDEINLLACESELRAKIRDDWRDYRMGDREVQPSPGDYGGLT